MHLLQLSFVAGVEGLAPKVHWNKMPSLIAAEVEGLARLSSPIFRFTFHLLRICLLLLGGRAASSGEVGQGPLNHRFGICIPMPWVVYACGGPSCASLSWVSCNSYSNDSCNVLCQLVVCEVEGPSIHCPSSPFQVYFMSCSNCCWCIGWVGSSREVGPCSLNDCLGICIGFILVVCAC